MPQDQTVAVAGAAGGGGGSMPAPVSLPVQRRALTAEQNELINRLVQYQEEYESPTKEDMRRSAVSTCPHRPRRSNTRGRGVGDCTRQRLPRALD